MGYVVRMVLRTILLLAGVACYVLAPDQITISESFGFRGGLNLIDVVFVFIFLDILTKFFPSAKISMGSLKQYGEFHVPTARMFKEGRAGSMAYVRDTIEQGRVAVERIPVELPAQVRTAFEETRAGAVDSLKVLLRSIDFLRIIPFKEEQLTASEEARNQIRADRFKEVIPVALAWVALNAAVLAVLVYAGLFNEPTLIIWVLFYFLFDMICVVLWCPIQLLLMKNRCCTTCHIFNWDAIMAVTPLLFLVLDLSTAWFVWPLVVMALVVLVRWELAFARYPERFDERTNASLLCANCKDKLCHIREPLKKTLAEIPGLAKPSGLDHAGEAPALDAE
ncbi:MAG: hypothetical protein IKV48_01230 [Eggerthellaceae bacterium]|nr:hypothetical protein [Eggerthellaceae bacterium]